MITTKQLATEALGRREIRSYERVKRFYMRLGHELALGFAAAVGGIHNPQGQADVTTRLGNFEFCASRNTKNHSGDKADELRGFRVQACGYARSGYLSGETFLAMHGVDQERADQLRKDAAKRAARGDHQQLDIEDTP